MKRTSSEDEMNLTPKDLFSQYAVEANSIEDFMARYYKPSRYTGRGEEYAQILLTSHMADLETFGIDWISKHDSVTGEIVSYLAN